MTGKDTPGAGLSLEQYAGVTAALAEGFDLAAVLAQEQIAADVWRESSADWKRRLAQAGPTGALFESYQKALAQAEDTLKRKVSPLDSDPVAWAGFLKVYSSSPEPALVLLDLDLGSNDLSRLARRWGAAAQSDEALRQKLAAAAEKEPRPIRGVKAGPRVLRRFPWSPEPPEPPAAAPQAATPEPVKTAPLAPAEPAESVSAVPSVPSFMRPGERVGPPVPLVPAVAPEAVRPVAPMVSVVPLVPPEVARPVGPIMPVVPPEVARPAASVKGSTSPGFVLPVRPAVPFQPGEAPPEIAVGTEPSKAPKADTASPRPHPLGETIEALPRPHPLGETQTAFHLPANLPLPFKKSEQAEAATPAAPASMAVPASTAAAGGRSPDAARAKHPLESTAHGVQLPIQPALPFEKGSPGGAAGEPATKKPADSQSANEVGYAAAGIPVAPRGEGVGTGTAAVFKRPETQPVLPFAKKTGDDKPAPAAPSPPAQAASAPSPPAPAAASKSAPALSLEQHAAMSLELAVLPRHAESVLLRYRIDAATRAELDEHYRVLVASSPQARAAWNRAYQAHHAKWQSGHKP